MEELGIYYADLRKCDRIISDFCDKFNITPQEYDNAINNTKKYIADRLNRINYLEVDKLTDIINTCKIKTFIAYVVTTRDIKDEDFKFGVNGYDIYISYRGQTIN